MADVKEPGTAPADAAATALWTPSPRANGAWSFAAHALGTLMVIASWMTALAVFRPLGSGVDVLASGAMIVLVIGATVAIHEAGHAIAASRAGMTVMVVQVFNVRLEARRRGWAWRWRKSPLGSHVWAVHDPSRPLRGQSLQHVAGGPLANAAAAFVFAVPAALLPEPWAPVLFVLAGWNAVMAVANLLPFTRRMPTDGLHLARWWHGIAEDHPSLKIPHVMALSISGVTADRLPAALVDSLAQGTPPERVVHRWIELTSHQNRGDWSAAEAMAEPIAQQYAALDAATAKALADLRVLIDIELAFSRALARGDAALLRTLPLQARTEAPWIALRARALLAAFDGDAASAERLLAASERDVELRVDASARTAEHAMRAAVRERLAVRPALASA
jgi:Zn-dependent protease